MTDARVPFTNAAGAPVADNTNILTAGPRGPALLQDVWLMEKLAHFDREVIPERRMHAKGWGAYGTFTVTNDITHLTRAKIFSEIGKQTDMFLRFSSVAGERGAADAMMCCDVDDCWYDFITISVNVPGINAVACHGVGCCVLVRCIRMSMLS